MANPTTGRVATADPLEKFRFQVTILNSSSATPSAAPLSFTGGFHDVQMPKRTTTKGTYRQGNFPDVNLLFPGISTMEDVVMSRGVTLSQQFFQWASAVHKGAATDSSLNTTNLGATNPAINNDTEFRKDLTITMFDRSGAPAKTWQLYNAWPVHFVPGSDLNASEDGEKAMESLTLAYEDFEEIT